MKIKKICYVSINLSDLEDFIKFSNNALTNSLYAIELFPPKGYFDLEDIDNSELGDNKDLRVTADCIELANFASKYDFKLDGRYYRMESDFNLYFEIIYEYFDIIKDKIKINSNTYSAEQEYLIKWAALYNLSYKFLDKDETNLRKDIKQLLEGDFRYYCCSYNKNNLKCRVEESILDKNGLISVKVAV